MRDLVYCDKKDLEKIVQKAIRQVIKEYEENSTKILTTKEVANLFKVSEATVCQWRKQGRIDYIQKGSIIRYTQEQINEFKTNSISHK